MNAIRMSLLSALLTMGAMPLWAEETVTVGGAVVPIADGWKQSTINGQVVLKPGDLPAGVGCTFTLAGGSLLEGSLKDRLAAEWKGFEAVGRVVTDDGGKIDGEGNAVEIASRSGTIQTPQKATIHVWLLLAKANGRAEIMIFITTTPDAWTKYGAAVSAMVNGTKYVVPKAPEAGIAQTPSSTPGAKAQWDGKPAEMLKGVCFGLVQVKTNLRPECWIFMPDGVVYCGFPFGGPAHLDIDLERKQRPKRFGDYKIDGDEIVANMTGVKEPTRFAQSQGAWAAKVVRQFTDRRQITRFQWQTWTDDVPTVLRITRAGSSDGLKLTGKYRLDAIDIKYAPKPVPSIQFTADGEFSEDGLVHEVDPGTLVADGKLNPTAMPKDGGRGKYSIAGNTLELVYADGTKLNLTFLATRDELAKAAPQKLYLHQSGLILVP